MQVADHNITYNQVLVLSQELQAAERKRQDGPFELSGRMPARARSSDAACEVPERAAERVGRQVRSKIPSDVVLSDLWNVLSNLLSCERSIEGSANDLYEALSSVLYLCSARSCCVLS